jgi:CheY-specific phosphatase CheX
MKHPIIDRVKEVVYNTFEVVCFLFPLDPWEAEEMEDQQLPSDVTRSMVTFDGAANGGMIIETSPSLLNAIAENMTGSEDATADEKEAALCELANIICGNTVPIFSNNNQICSIHPPSILNSDKEIPTRFSQMEKESLKVFLDEGPVRLSLFYSNGQTYD